MNFSYTRTQNLSILSKFTVLYNFEIWTLEKKFGQCCSRIVVAYMFFIATFTNLQDT